METLSVQTKLETVEGLVCPPEAQVFLKSIEAGESDGVSCWRAPEVVRRDGSEIEGKGLFALTDIPPGSLLAIKQGHVVDSSTVKANADIIQGSHQQIGENEFLVGLNPEEVDKNLIGYNHSCDPNARVVLFKDVNLSFLVSRKPIQTGQEVTADYSVSEKTDTHLMKRCRCGSADCRGVVAPAWDWEDEALQQKYAGELAWFIEEAIEERKHATEPERQALIRHDGTLKLAALVGFIDSELAQMAVEKKELFDQAGNQSPVLRTLLRGIYPMTRHGKELRDFKEKLIVAATQFCLIAPFGNIEEMGINRYALPENLTVDEKISFLRPMVQENLNEVIEFARTIDRFNF